jgi:hypothetical protein
MGDHHCGRSLEPRRPCIAEAWERQLAPLRPSAVANGWVGAICGKGPKEPRHLVVGRSGRCKCS